MSEVNLRRRTTTTATCTLPYLIRSCTLDIPVDARLEVLDNDDMGCQVVTFTWVDAITEEIA